MSDSMKVPLTVNHVIHPWQHILYYSAKVSSFNSLTLQNHGTAMIQCLSTQTEHARVKTLKTGSDIPLVPRTYVSCVHGS